MLHCELVYGTSFSSVSVVCLQIVLDRSQAYTHTHSLTLCKYAIYAILILNLALRIANLKLVNGHLNMTSQGGFIEMSQHNFDVFKLF